MGRVRALSILLWLTAGHALAQEGTASPPASAEAPPQPRSGTDARMELGLQAGYAWGTDDEALVHGGPGARLHLLARLGPYLALGPEVALYAHAGSRIQIGREEVGSLQNEALFQLGGVVRAGLALGPVRPAIVGGLAWYRAENSRLGYSVGVEVELNLVDGLALVADARYHDDFEDRPNNYFRTLGLGTRLFW
nr:outer membrane beta-barrel protein [Pyxidicoccus trucidator]